MPVNVARYFSLRSSKSPEANFPHRQSAKRGGGRILFIKCRPSSDRIHRNKIGFMTTSVSATRISDAEISGAHAGRYLHVGQEHYAAGRIDQAIAAYQRGLAVAENGPPGFVSVET